MTRPSDGITKDLGGDAPVCRACVTDEYLWDRVRSDAERSKCAICRRRRLCAPLARIADEVDAIFRANVELGETRKVFRGDDERGAWEQEGDELELLMQEVVGCDIELANALIDVLAEDEWYIIKDGGDLFYDSTSNYVYAADPPHEHHEVWRDFHNRVKYGGRFLDEEARRALDELLTDFPDQWATRDDGPDQTHKPASLNVFRARSASTPAEARQILADPRTALGPPPRRSRSAGRLNAHGIGVFYGGLSEDVCIAELRPSLASYVVVGQFDLIQPVRLLDLTAFDRHVPSGSLFRPGYADERLRWQFLRSFHLSITQPVQPGSEVLQYVPTQVIGEYLYAALGYDGVVYRSAQVGAADGGDMSAAPLELRNLALFGADGLVEETNRAEADEPVEKEVEPFLVDFPSYVTPPSPSRSAPLLRYVEGSASVYEVSRIRYEWERTYIGDAQPSS